jgi:hypothetical protein
MYTGFAYLADDICTLDRLTGFEASIPASAGFVTGVLFNHARGPRAAILSGFIGCGLSSAYWYGGSFFNSLFNNKKGRY